MQGTPPALRSIASAILDSHEDTSSSSIYVDVVHTTPCCVKPAEDSIRLQITTTTRKPVETRCDNATPDSINSIVQQPQSHLADQTMNSNTNLEDNATEPVRARQQTFHDLSPLLKNITAADLTTAVESSLWSSHATDYLHQSSTSSSVLATRFLPYCSDDVDTRDTSPVHDPIHNCFRTTSSSCDGYTVRVHAADCVSATYQEEEDDAAAADVVCFHRKPPRLTLSAFRRPEQTIRLTHADPYRRLEAEYDLQAPKCGVLGHGAFSTVRLAVRRCDGIQVAVKSIAKHEALRSRRLRLGGRSYLEEWEILRRLQHHPNVITLIDVLENDEEIQIVTEYCQGGELFDAIQKKKRHRFSHNKRRGQYTEAQAARITNQILSALADLHEQGIVHRDVKPENILLANDDESMLHVKLCDFGVARPLCDDPDPDSPHPSSSDSTIAGFLLGGGDDGDASPLIPGRSASFSTIGTDYYAAPEIVFGGSYTTAVDVYSLGVTLYIVLCGFPPVFSGEDDDDEVVFPITYWKDISDDAKGLLRKMLHPEPTERICAKDAMLNKWIKENMESGPAHPTSRRSNLSSSSAESQKCQLLDLNLVRNQLLRSLEVKAVESDKKKHAMHTLPTTTPSNKRTVREPIIGGVSISTSPSPFKRARYERRGSLAFLALADLYRGVGTTPSGIMAASTAVDSVPTTPTLDDSVDELATEQHEQSKNIAALSF